MNYEWAIIGAGPAGIATVGRLIDEGVDPKTIVWFDPEFSVGDFGGRWRNVPSNTKVALFQKFLLSCDAFDFKTTAHEFELFDIDPEKTCRLKVMADAVQRVSDHLCEQVAAIATTVKKIRQHDGCWQLQCDQQNYQAKNVVLAMGSEPKTLTYDGVETVALQKAMDAQMLNGACTSDDTVAVFGSSHSAILAIRNLIETTAIKKIINFYRSPLCFAVQMDGWILYDNTGLKGTTAEWAKNEFDKFIPSKVERYISNDENITQHLPRCSKAIYAVGFERRSLPIVDDIEHLTYCDKTGVIAPNLFGVGIAFPELVENPHGICEYNVGLWKFMDYLNRVVPTWLQS